MQEALSTGDREQERLLRIRIGEGRGGGERRGG